VIFIKIRLSRLAKAPDQLGSLDFRARCHSQLPTVIESARVELVVCLMVEKILSIKKVAYSVA
jgi:hypothetical protein